MSSATLSRPKPSRPALVRRPVPPPPHEDFDDYNTAQLRECERKLRLALHRQSAAQAVRDSLATRATAFQASVAAAQAQATTAAANLVSARTTTQTVDQGVPLATAAKAQAELISANLAPVLAKAQETALLMLEAITAINALAKQVARRQGKNELISPLVVTGAAQAQASSAAALGAITTALQNTLLAVAATQEASGACDKVVATIRRTRRMLAPAQGFDVARPSAGGLWPAGGEPQSVPALTQALRANDVTVLAILDALAKIATQALAEQQAVSTQTALELNSAQNTLDRATAAVAAATASLAAAEAAVT